MEITDNQLVKRILGGDSALFAVLVERYKKQVYNLMYRYSGSADEAADLTQEVFCRVYEKLARYREHKSFFSWLYALALNHARDWSRRRRFNTAKLGRLADEPGPDPASPGIELEAKQQAERLTRALATLPEDRREMVLLRYRHDHSIKDLADIFQLSESAVKMRLQRSLAELNRQLQGWHYETRN